MSRKILTLILIAISAIQLNAQVYIADRYELAGGKGAETNMILIGKVDDVLPINYYLSYNACSTEDIWMIHCIPWTEFEVILPYDAKVLIKTFDDNFIELTSFTNDDGNTISECRLNDKTYNRYVSGVHCKLSFAQLEQIINEGINKIRIQTTFPNGYIEREYADKSVSNSLSRARNILWEELKPVDIYEGF